MKFIDFNHDDCDECYKCLRACPTKAIIFNKNERSIINERCIKCGICQIVCPQKALKIHSNIDKVKDMLTSGSTIVASVAPSFACGYNIENPLSLVTALKNLGFDYVEETGAAAEIVSENYMSKLNNWQEDNAISTCCPSANYIVEKYYPRHIPQMIDTFSPMLAHGKLIKEKYGPKTKVVFIGPCLAKKAEASEYTEHIDAVLTFHELQDWFTYRKWNIDILPPTKFDCESPKHGKMYPMGVLKSCADDSNYSYLKVDGFDQCKELLESLNNGKVKNKFIELNVCQGSCINGPDYPNKNTTVFERMMDMSSYIETCSETPSYYTYSNIALDRKFKDKTMDLEKPHDFELVEILRNIGKYDPTDYLNCGACGYSTCMEKAEATFYGYSEAEMCMPYLRTKAESMQSIIFENTPNLICILDRDLNLIEYNPAFDRCFNYTNNSIKNLPIYALMNKTLFSKAFEMKKSLLGIKERFSQINKVFYMNLIYIEADDVVLSIMTDITSNEKDKEELLVVKENTLKVCQEVISKQMRVAQEIASLLGETTAETKINLDKLRDIVLSEDGE